MGSLLFAKIAGSAAGRWWGWPLLTLAFVMKEKYNKVWNGEDKDFYGGVEMFGKGRIDIIIPKTNFAPGDTISGNVVLAMKKPVKAREVNISLIGEQTTTRGGVTSTDRSQSTVRIYDFKHRLDGEKEYDKEAEYHFEIKIPADLLNRQPQMPQMEGVLGQGFKIVQSLAGLGVWTNWYLLARLDVPSGMDINKKVQITIG